MVPTCRATRFSVVPLALAHLDLRMPWVPAFRSAWCHQPRRDGRVEHAKCERDPLVRPQRNGHMQSERLDGKQRGLEAHPRWRLPKLTPNDQHSLPHQLVSREQPPDFLFDSIRRV